MKWRLVTTFILATTSCRTNEKIEEAPPVTDPARPLVTRQDILMQSRGDIRLVKTGAFHARLADHEEACTWWSLADTPSGRTTLFVAASRGPAEKAGSVDHRVPSLDPAPVPSVSTTTLLVRMGTLFSAWARVGPEAGGEEALREALYLELEALRDDGGFGHSVPWRYGQLRLDPTDGPPTSSYQVEAIIDHVVMGRPARHVFSGQLRLTEDASTPSSLEGVGSWSNPSISFFGDTEIRGTFEYRATWTYGHDLPPEVSP